MATQPRTRIGPAVAVLAAGVALARALAFSGTELYSDEAYYWLWAQRPAAGYFDHPPLVAWLIALSSRAIPGEIGVRLPFLACGSLTVVFAALLAGELSADARAPFLAALLAAAAPMMSLSGALALPDAPLAAAYTAALWLIARARGRRWLGAGVAVGIALLSKYTAALLAPALLVLVLWDRELRAELRAPWPWLGAAAAVAIFAPCLAWNARHGWVSIRFQLFHGFSGSATPRSVLEYFAGQAIGVGPVALAVGAAALVRERTSAWKRVAAAALLPLAVTTYAAFRGKVEANWPALTYPALAAAAGATLARWGQPSARRDRALAAGSRRAAALLAWGSLALTAAILVAFGVEQRAPRLLAGTPATERFHGWRALGAAARRAAEARCPEVACDARDPFVFPGSYQYAGELAFYAGFKRLGPAAERESQLDVWGDRPRPGEGFLFIGHDPSGAGSAAARGGGQERPAQRTPVLWASRRVRDLVVIPFAGTRGAARPPP
jgi:4-amino-4-deoxy-L-arabinose transferase-like glycosyltransferase